MIFTNVSGNIQPYTSWKGDYNMVKNNIPVNARPLTNGEVNDILNPQMNRSGKALVPIKHWRKQLKPINSTDQSSCVTNDYVHREPNTKCISNQITKYGQTAYISCHPESKIIKSARMLTTNNYSRDTKEYLRKKCKTYEQRLTGSNIPNNTYATASGQHVYPTNSSTGSQLKKPLNCYDTSCQIIFKPNNVKFTQQGAVTSSDRLVRLKLDTITKNGNSFKTAWGQEAANAGKYHGTTEAPYFIKNKFEKAPCFTNKNCS